MNTPKNDESTEAPVSPLLLRIRELQAAQAVSTESKPPLNTKVIAVGIIPPDAPKY